VPATPAPIPRSIFGDLREIAAELRHCTEILHQLTLRDIRIRYKQAAFGFAWALLIPAVVVLAGLVMRVAFSHVAGAGIDMAQIAGIAIKSVPWGFFVGSLNTTTPSLLASRTLVTKVYFPREVLPIATLLAQTFDSAIALGLVAVLLPFLGVRPTLQLLWVPLILATLWVFTLALGLFLSCANLFFRDVKYLVQVFLTFGIFVTPVLLEPQMFGPKGARFMLLNPVGTLLEALRLSVVKGHNLLDTLYAPAGFVIWRPMYLGLTMLWAVVGLALAAVFFHRSERRFAELV
jgi:ABC-type polysaccharide/polyol phosphate export permease